MYDLGFGLYENSIYIKFHTGLKPSQVKATEDDYCISCKIDLVSQ
jgi:hypothetical protein